MSYVKPNEVVSPKARWKLIAVLEDGGRGGMSYALGEWDGEPRIGVRWNGDSENRIGNPQSRGLPTWTMLAPKLHMSVIQGLPADEQLLARKFLRIKADAVVELKIDYHASRRYTLKKRPVGQRMYQDAIHNSRLMTNPDKADFLEAVCSEIKVHLEDGTRVILHDF